MQCNNLFQKPPHAHQLHHYSWRFVCTKMNECRFKWVRRYWWVPIALIIGLHICQQQNPWAAHSPPLNSHHQTSLCQNLNRRWGFTFFLGWRAFSWVSASGWWLFPFLPVFSPPNRCKLPLAWVNCWKSCSFIHLNNCIQCITSFPHFFLDVALVLMLSALVTCFDAVGLSDFLLFIIFSCCYFSGGE